MKIYSKSTTTNKTKVKLLKLPKRIENNLQLKKFMNDAITQLFTEEKANQENKDSVLTTKQKPYVLKEILTQLKQNNNIDAKLNKTINLLIRNVNSFIAIAKQEKLNEQGKVKNFIPSTEYEEILRGLTLFTLNSSFSKIINLTTSKEKINIYKKDDNINNKEDVE